MNRRSFLWAPAMLAGCAGMAALPLGPGFAPEFLLLHAVFGAAGTATRSSGACTSSSDQATFSRFNSSR